MISFWLPVLQPLARRLFLRGSAAAAPPSPPSSPPPPVVATLPPLASPPSSPPSLYILSYLKEGFEVLGHCPLLPSVSTLQQAVTWKT